VGLAYHQTHNEFSKDVAAIGVPSIFFREKIIELSNIPITIFSTHALLP
jgi:hypothetical protein